MPEIKVKVMVEVWRRNILHKKARNFHAVHNPWSLSHAKRPNTSLDHQLKPVSKIVINSHDIVKWPIGGRGLTYNPSLGK
jgi:hypothetical protein